MYLNICFVVINCCTICAILYWSILGFIIKNPEKKISKKLSFLKNIINESKQLYWAEHKYSILKEAIFWCIVCGVIWPVTLIVVYIYLFSMFLQLIINITNDVVNKE